MTKDPLGGCWRLAFAPCLGEATIDVRGDNAEECLENAFDQFTSSFVQEAGF